MRGRICRKCGEQLPHIGNCPPLLMPRDVTRKPGSNGRTMTYFTCPKCFTPTVSLNEPSRFGVITDKCHGQCRKIISIRLKEYEKPRPITRDTDIDNHKHRSARPTR